MLSELIALTAKARGQPIAMTAHEGPSGDGVVKASGAQAVL
jgi:hypothetical protein